MDTTNITAKILETLEPGDMVTVEGTALRRPRKLIVTSIREDGAAYVTSGRTRPGHVQGGVIEIRDGAVEYQPTMLQPYVLVSRVTRRAAALA